MSMMGLLSRSRTRIESGPSSSFCKARSRRSYAATMGACGVRCWDGRVSCVFMDHMSIGHTVRARTSILALVSIMAWSIQLLFPCRTLL